jgi:hypothetical protein
MNDEEFAALQQFLGKHPEVGDVMPRAGGLRKMRWMGRGTGKRGGLRIIYYNQLLNREIILVAIYDKREIESLTSTHLKILREEIKK